MLVNTHHPVISSIRTHDGDAACPEFHTVQLAETKDSGALINLFIASDWSNWDAIVEQVTEYRQFATVRAEGAAAGKSMGSWVIDGNTSREYAQRIIAGYDEGDPEIMDMTPAPLSGEWSDGPTTGDVMRMVGIDPDALDGNGESLFDVSVLESQLGDEYETAFVDAYWDEVIRAATIVAEPFTCAYCGDPEDECSANPCAAVVADRGESVDKEARNLAFIDDYNNA